MIKQFSAHENLVYQRFRRAVVNMPVVIDGQRTAYKELVFSEEDNESLDRALDDARAICEEMEDGEGGLSSDDSQINVLAMMAVCDSADVMLLGSDSFDGVNFDD